MILVICQMFVVMRVHETCHPVACASSSGGCSPSCGCMIAIIWRMIGIIRQMIGTRFAVRLALQWTGERRDGIYPP